MLRYAPPSSWSTTGDIELKDNFTFEDVLVYDNFARGRSAAYLIFKSKNDGKTYYMFLKDLHDAMKYLIQGQLHGQFTFCKRGENYGVKFLIPPNGKL
jgi:hypothetical protein